MKRRLICFAAILILSGAPTAAQQPVGVGGELDWYIRFLELEGKVSGTPLVYHATSLRPVSNGLAVDSTHPWERRHPLRNTSHYGVQVKPADWVLRVVYNSAYPRSLNDGTLWAGRGMSGALEGGATLESGPLRATVAPTVTVSQNRIFTLAPVTFSGRSEFAYPWQQDIDWPQRFGNGSVQRVDWGQSGARMTFGAFTAGLSTEQLWWGPGYRNAIIMSNNAGGIPHVDLGTGRPARTPIGDVEMRAIWGVLHKSDYFTAQPGSGRRFLNGGTLGYRPNFLPGLTLGIARVAYKEWPAEGLSLGDLLSAYGSIFNKGNTPLPGGGVGNDYQDQLASAIARWVFPRSGAEVYLEWARNDFSGGIRDLLIEPDHSSGFTAGIQKTLPSGAGRWRLVAEHTTLSRPATFLTRAEPSFYVHGYAIEGYTNGGQLLGAWIGPGSNSHFLGLDRYTASGRWGVSLERVRWDDDGFYERFQNVASGFTYHQIDLTVGGSVLRFFKLVDVEGRVELSRRLNVYFERYHDLTNFQMAFSVRWRGR